MYFKRPHEQPWKTEGSPFEMAEATDGSVDRRTDRPTDGPTGIHQLPTRTSGRQFQRAMHEHVISRHQRIGVLCFTYKKKFGKSDPPTLISCTRYVLYLDQLVLPLLTCEWDTPVKQSQRYRAGSRSGIQTMNTTVFFFFPSPCFYEATAFTG